MRIFITFSALLILASSLCAVANPINIEDIKQRNRIEKNWERCHIAVGERNAQVSCAIGYAVLEKHSSTLKFEIPVYWPSTMSGNVENIIRTTAMRIESGNHIFYPHSITRTFEDGTTDTTKLSGGKPVMENPKLKNKPVVSAKLGISLLQRRSKDFSMVLTYTQPLIQGKVHYLPLFEKGEKPIGEKELRITFFPASGQTLKLLTNHPKRVKARMKTRITIIPRHRELISVLASPGHYTPQQP